MESIKTVIITQARVGSTRFPNKVTRKLSDTTLLGMHLERIKGAKNATHWIVATTEEEGVNEIVDIAKNANVDVYQGSLNDVLDRFYQAASIFQPDYVVRVTSDCPLIDPNLIDQVIEATLSSNADYGANIFIEEFPDGQDVEVFTFAALKNAWENAVLPSEREHVTPFIRNNSDLKNGTLFKAIHYPCSNNFNHVRMTVDEPQDLETVEKLVAILGKNETWETYTNYLIHHINLFNNQDILRNEGYLKSLKNDKI